MNKNYSVVQIDCDFSPEYQSWKRLQLSKSKLSIGSQTSGIFAGFAIVSTVELQINDGDANEALILAFVIVTSILVANSMLSILTATCILPQLESIIKMEKIDLVNKSPHDKLAGVIEISWVLSNTLSIFLFTLLVILLCHIKFSYFSKVASWSATLIMGPVLIIVCVFGLVFYKEIAHHEYKICKLKYKKLEQMKLDLDKMTKFKEKLRAEEILEALKAKKRKTFSRSLSSGAVLNI